MAPPSLTCLCSTISLPLPNLVLPAPTELCHCNPCRQVSGALLAGFVQLPTSPDAATLDKMIAYESSATHTRLFCANCGTKTVVHVHHHPNGRDRDVWYAYAGAVERAEGEEQSNIMLAETNEWVDDTGDGGLAPFMTKLGNRDVPAYRITQDTAPFTQTELEDLNKSTLATTKPPNPDERLHASCRCGAITLQVKPADHTNKAISKLERFVPTTTAGEKLNDKYQARTCVCRSCRLAMGVSLTTHTYIPPAQILNPHTGAPLAYAHALETPEGREANKGLEALAHYWSSANACRSFCGNCGSTVFYWNEKRQDIVNIAAGILRAEDGALARRWFYWMPGMVSWKDEVVDREVLEAYREADVNG